MSQRRRLRALTRCCAAVAASMLVAALASAEPFTTIRYNGDSARRVDLVIMGDGYTASDLGTNRFANDVEAFVQSMFQQEPFLEYRAYFNVHRVDVTSNESGVDHPERGVFRDTALDSFYNCGGIQRLICVDMSQVNGVLSRTALAPNARELILVIVNDTEYGGSGGAVAVASIHPSAVEIILHELGHSFGLLADEYGGPPPPSCNPSAANPNVTGETTRALIKWNVWINPSTPVPTAGPTTGVPGLYQGAAYCDTQLYRPTYNSKMRSLGVPFEQINAEQFVKRIYNWASPIDSYSPTSESVSLSAPQTFSVTSPVPRTHALDVQWRLDGSLLGSGSQITLAPGAVAPGSHTLSAVARDTTAFVRNDPGALLQATQSWTVTVQCLYGLTPTSGTFDAVGGSASFNVTTTSGCGWTAVSDDPFVSITAGASGSGNGVVSYTVAPNTGPPNVENASRSTTIAVATESHAVSQNGCLFNAQPQATTFGAAGGAGGVTVLAPAVCAWTVENVPAWATTIGGAAGTGVGAWTFSVDPNGGGSRSQSVSVAGKIYSLNQLDVNIKALIPGRRTRLTLGNSSDTAWFAVDVVAGRSYCVELAPDAVEDVAATPVITVLRDNGGQTVGASATRVCSIASSAETLLVRVTQSDGGLRRYALAVGESTIWANWFFTAGSYSSFTLLRNTSADAVTATITWRSEAGVAVVSETVVLPAGAVYSRDARTAAPGATAGSVEVGHTGDPQALVGSQTTLTAATGLSFDTVFLERQAR
jgi:IgA Peptidase M64